MSAYEQKDAAQRAAAMEAFAAQYPSSVVHLDALEQAMAGYQQAGSRDKVAALSAEVLQADPDNLRALAIQVFLLRAKATNDDAQALDQLRQTVAHGLKLLANWRRPEGLSDADFAKLKTQVSSILNGAAGFLALRDKDYAQAQAAYLQAVTADPNDLQSVYQLALAYLETTPVEPDGFWYLARAIALAGSNANAQVQDQIKKYAVAKYRAYHGSEEGWSELLAKAAKASAKPAGFTVKAL
jgi:hypothetical protein